MGSIVTGLSIMILLFISSEAQCEETARNHADVTEQVYMQSFDPQSNMYGGLIVISASPCPGIIYSINLPFSGAKGAEDAKTKVKQQFEAIADDIDKAKGRCKH